jgi:hypothetical protein
LFCVQNPHFDCGEVADAFTGWSNLKRSHEARVEWIKQHLCSMLRIGIPLSTDSNAVAESQDFELETVLGFEERALVKGWDVGTSWTRFKKLNELTDDYRAIESETPDESIAGEALDFGTILESKLSPIERVPRDQLVLEFQQIAARIIAELDCILLELDRNKPTAGFPPIAWHNVWWYFVDKYDGLRLRLRLDEPWCETDHALADRIAQFYPQYTGVSRPSIYRRRSHLTTKCEEIIVGHVYDHFGH